MAEATNPLFDSQREKAGSQTKDKYNYQYHWALYKVLTEHQTRKEYAVFVELHEDVVICDSLNSENVNFELNQVKTTNKNISHNELTKLKKRVKGTSVLAKLVENTNKKSYSSKIKNLNLVSVYPFTLELKSKGITLDKITLDDLSDSQLKKLEVAIENELGKEVSLPKHLQFIVSNLSEKNYQNDVIAAISTLIEKMHPDSYCKPNDIYRLLINEIDCKGVVTYDFVKWDDLLNRKALTSITINNIINQYTNIKNEEIINSEFNDIANELGLKSIPRKKLKNGFNRYRLLRLGNKSVLQLETTEEIVKLIKYEIENDENNMKNLIENVINKLDIKYKSTFSNSENLKGAIICEYILDNE
jgi:hypothetical protein